LVKGKEKVDPAYLDHGIRMAKGIAKLDIGQGVVVRKGTTLATEAFEGTDPMLQRAGTFKADKMIFVKTSKPNQNFCFDVPVFGLRTVEVMAKAGIKTAAVEANTTILLHQNDVLDAAKRAGITVLGYEA
ncbi:MAG TPA: DUF1009 domain-containing protein, partial [Opitutae bacterium]|nr:DUF1009 domain-containing protein [Opitutae bacterium]